MGREKDTEECAAGRPGNGSSESGTIDQECYQGIARKHLSGSLPELFKGFTDLDLNVKWAPPEPLPWHIPVPEGAFSLCKLICSNRAGRSACREFAASQLDSALKKAPRPHRFVCPFGIRNFWFPLYYGNRTVAFILCQALRRPAVGEGNDRLKKLNLPPAALRRTLNCCTAKTKSEFDHSAKLAKLIADDVMLGVENRLTRQELDKSSRAVIAHEELETRMREQLNHFLPHISDKAAVMETEEPIGKVIRRAMKFINENYHRPLLLKDLAAESGLNMFYFSTLFKQHSGMSVRNYLKELRMEKAQGMLHDPLRRVSDVAYAVGYLVPNSFRLAFKEHTGLSPSAWRRTLNSNASG